MARFFSRRRRGGGVSASKPKTQKNKNNAKKPAKKPTNNASNRESYNRTVQAAQNIIRQLQVARANAAKAEREIKELVEKQQKVSNVLSAPLSTELPDADLEQMMANLDAELRAKGQMPPPKQKTPEEEELNRMLASLNTNK